MRAQQFKSQKNVRTHLGVDDDLHPFHRPVLGEDVIQFVFGGVDAQTEHAETAGWFRIVAGAHVAPATRHRAM